MLDRNGRIAVIIASVVVAIAAFVLLSPGDEETEPTSTTAATPAATTPAPTAAATEEATEAPTAEPTPADPAIEVNDGKVTGGVQEIKVKQNETVRFSVASDAPDHIHVHGYDLIKDVKAGSPARMSFKAEITGIFEIELEDSRLHIANLRVEP